MIPAPFFLSGVGGQPASVEFPRAVVFAEVRADIVELRQLLREFAQRPLQQVGWQVDHGSGDLSWQPIVKPGTSA